MEGSARQAYAAGLVAAVLVVLFTATSRAYNPTAGDFSRIRPSDIRILSYNTKQNFISDASRDAAFNRVLVTINPDVVVFQEIALAVSATEVATRLDSVLPGGDRYWQTNDGLDDGWSRVVVASKYPLALRRNDTYPPSSTRGVNLCLVDLPGTYATDIYLLGVHLKAGGTSSDDAKRQRSADAIAAWLGDARQAGGYITLAPYTPMIIAGDFNLVGGPQPETTLITGDIVDNATFGPDIKGDWDASNLLDLMPTDPFTGDADTWSSDQVNPGSRLDRFIYTDSAAIVAARFVLSTLTMSAPARAAAGLQGTDTTSAATSDHLPVVMDLYIPLLTGCSEPFADFDRDGDVDQADFGAWQVCTRGMDLPVEGQCLCFDRDGDSDVDASDLSAFMQCFAGPNQQPPPGCAGGP